MTTCQVCELHGDTNPATSEVRMGIDRNDPGEPWHVCEWHKRWADERARQTPREEPWWWWKVGNDGTPTDPCHPWSRAPRKAPVIPIRGNDAG